MKTSQLLTLCVMSAATLSFVSCDDDKDADTIYRYDFRNGYAAVTDIRSTDGGTTVSSPVTIVMNANWTTAHADLNISGLKIGTAVYPTMQLQQLPWGPASGKIWNEVHTSLTTASLPTGMAQVSDFRLRWCDRIDLSKALDITDYVPAVAFTYTIDDRYKVVGAMQPLMLAGETVSTPQGGEGYKSDVSLYAFTLDFEKNTAALKINKAAFAKKMPLLDMEFTSLPFSVDGDANVTIDSDSFIPSMGGVPMPDYPITDFHAYINPIDARGKVTFVCNYKGHPFTVEATLDFTSTSGFINATL